MDAGYGTAQNFTSLTGECYNNGKKRSGKLLAGRRDTGCDILIQRAVVSRRYTIWFVWITGWSRLRGFM